MLDLCGHLEMILGWGTMTQTTHIIHAWFENFPTEIIFQLTETAMHIRSSDYFLSSHNHCSKGQWQNKHINCWNDKLFKKNFYFLNIVWHLSYIVICVSGLRSEDTRWTLWDRQGSNLWTDLRLFRQTGHQLTRLVAQLNRLIVLPESNHILFLFSSLSTFYTKYLGVC